MAKGYFIDQLADGSTDVVLKDNGVYVKHDNIKKVDAFSVTDDGKIQIWVAGVLPVPAFYPAKVLAISGSDPNAGGLRTPYQMVELLRPVFPDASSTGSGGGATTDASDLTSGTLDGNRLPAISTTKKGGVPATGTPSGKFLKDNGTWDDPVGGGGAPAGTINFAGVADGVQLYDAVTSNGSATLTSASAAFTAGDIGKSIAVVGAGAAGAHLVTTISAVGSPTSITLAAAASGASSTGWVAYGTDDTAAWQAALDAATAARGAKIVAAPGITIIAGALHTTGGFNAQVKIPTNTNGEDHPYTIEIAGPFAAPSVTFWPAKPPDTGLIIFSFGVGSGTRPAVFGSSQSPGGFSGFNQIRLNWYNTIFRQLPNPSLTNIDAKLVGSFSMWDCYHDVLASIDQLLTVPSNATGVAFYCSGRGSQCVWEISRTYIAGYYAGWESGECGVLDNVFSFACAYTGINPAVDYSCDYGKVVSSWCPGGMLWTGDHHCNIQKYQTEQWDAGVGHGAAWMAIQYNFDCGVGNDYWRGKCFAFTEITAHVGRTNILYTRGCDYAIIHSGSHNLMTIDTIVDTDPTLNEAFVPIPSAIIYTKGGGDVSVYIEAVISLNNVSGNVYLVFMLANPGTGAEVSGSRGYAFNIGSVTNLTEIRTFTKVITFRNSGPVNAAYQLCCAGLASIGGSITIKGYSTVGTAGSKMTLRPA